MIAALLLVVICNAGQCHESGFASWTGPTASELTECATRAAVINAENAQHLARCEIELAD